MGDCQADLRGDHVESILDHDDGEESEDILAAEDLLQGEVEREDLAVLPNEEDQQDAKWNEFSLMFSHDNLILSEIYPRVCVYACHLLNACHVCYIAEEKKRTKIKHSQFAKI